MNKLRYKRKIIAYTQFSSYPHQILYNNFNIVYNIIILINHHNDNPATPRLHEWIINKKTMLWKMICERCNNDWYTDGVETTCEVCKRPASWARRLTEQEWAELHNAEPFDITNE